MKNIIHAIYTWLLAVMVALFFLAVYNWIKYSWEPADIFSRSLFTIVPLSYIVAIPALILGIVFLCLLESTDYSVYEKLLLWYLSCLVAVFLNMLILVLLLGMENDMYRALLELWLVFPAVLVAITLRYRQFILLNNKTTAHETTMV